MARKKNLIPQFVTFNTQEMIMHIDNMTDEQLGAWFRRALIDLCSGCIDPQTDPIIKDIYKHSHERMVKAQNHNQQMYNNRIARTNDQKIKTNSNEESERIPETDSCETTTNLPEVASKSGTIKSDKKAFGTNSHVMLTIEEGNKLRKSYGPDLNLAIDILDSYIENNGKAAKKYKNHYAVLRRGNWVWNKVKETKLQEQRLENASNSNKSFKQQDLDARTEFFTHSIFDNGNTDEQI